MNMKLIDMIEESSKSKKYSTGVDLPDYLDNYLENIKNMLTVKEGTALAGGFCNWIMEVARNYNLDMVTARAISNRLQRVALDSKHTSGISNFMELPWAKLATLRNDIDKNTNRETIRDIIDSIINEEDVDYDKENFYEIY